MNDKLNKLIKTEEILGILAGIFMLICSIVMMLDILNIEFIHISLLKDLLFIPMGIFLGLIVIWIWVGGKIEKETYKGIFDFRWVGD